VAQEAEALNHHPNLLVGWRQVTVRLTTHSAGGLTGLDVTLAGNISAV
ncbi:MAG TPA: 4a-hydroxytetrahydrobiopterin dehydratase, partial [Verrucomicrobiales bacterium]|nr:4a-hydroxytetrahydrobiopterin dehydratase [Verrucomicrobiales bacterium]